MRSILVTGGAGYIGSHACKALANAGYLPIAYDNLSRGHAWAAKWGPLEVGDIADEARLADVFGRYRPEAVMHFAAFAYVGESVVRPDIYYANNVSGTLGLLRAMHAAGVQRLVFSSTCATYGMAETIPISEEHPQRPINPYGWTKLFIEQALKDHANAFGLRAISLRYFNAAGADPAGDVGEAHEPETHLIPLVLQAAAGDIPSVTVFGDDYDTRDGTCIRDYIHVTDLANAHLLALEALDAAAGFRAYNLGNGRGFSVKEVIDAAALVTGQEIPVTRGSRRPGDPPRLVGDAARIRGDLGWTTHYSDLQAIVETAWNWHRSSAAGAAVRHGLKQAVDD